MVQSTDGAWRGESGQGFLIRWIEALPITSGMLTGHRFEIQA
jgi:hypothetical protein